MREDLIGQVRYNYRHEIPYNPHIVRYEVVSTGLSLNGEEILEIYSTSIAFEGKNQLYISITDFERFYISEDIPNIEIYKIRLKSHIEVVDAYTKHIKYSTNEFNALCDKIKIEDLKQKYPEEFI